MKIKQLIISIVNLLRSKSLAWRIFSASVILLPILLGFSAFMLDRAFRKSVYNSEQDSLLAYTYSMMAVAEPDEGFLLIPDALRESPFNDPASGLYAQIVDDEFGPIWESISLSISPFTAKIPYKHVEIGEFSFSTEEIEGESFFISRFNSVWEIEEIDREFQFVVIHSQAKLRGDLLGYRKTLLGWLSGLAILLIIVQTAIIRWGLFPLKRLALDIKQLESGLIQSLDKNYPEEIVPVTQNINLLLSSEQKQRKRYKNTLADLAHSLKTPLSVIRSVIEKHFPQAEKKAEWELAVNEQIERMTKIISHQLNRATATKASFQSTIKLTHLIKRIGNALEKVYQDKNIQFTLHIKEDLDYAAQEADFMEVLGNILENAFKYGHGKVTVDAIRNKKSITIKISDDGDGVPESMRNEILERGARVDTSTPGQGIGLAVAAEIISSYDGGILVEKSHLGGACFILTLPV
ncbi:ATP-binding protein [Agarilytica rhodophyticola]|uniref:ATP-binding protein n=1 Tax=Agarilytica rhodophyticola TaxID=1737490 RepID=UPI000CD889D2|nr:ATP-binding protein [Agarilytica rhodophyticola]